MQFFNRLSVVSLVNFGGIFLDDANLLVLLRLRRFKANAIDSIALLV